MEYVADVHYFPDRAYRDSAHEASGCEMSFVYNCSLFGEYALRTQRTALKPMLPNKPRGVRRVNDTRVRNGIFWVLR